ncbi:MAG: hypothetical protein JJT78_14335 [Leptospira sp.]|nr:hypothetical protein [Leptospira sp.]
MTYQEGIEQIQNYTAGGSISQVLNFFHSVHSSHENPNQFLDEIGASDSYPDSLEGLILYIGSILQKRRQISVLYEKAMDRYQQVSELTAKRRATDDEGRIKENLTDFILKAEKLFELNDLTDESIVKELNRFTNESNLMNLTEGELQKMIVSSKTMTLLEPHMDKLREIYYGYEKLFDPLSRLIRIADYILEDGKRMAV